MPGRRVEAPARLRAMVLTLALSVAGAVFAGPAGAATTVSLTFDDAQATQYQVKDVLTAHGMDATFFVNSGKVGTSEYYMTWPQVTAIAADGNEIAGHTLTHPDLAALSDAQRRTEVCNDRQNLIARGFDPVSFAYPDGFADETVQAVVRDCGYTVARRIGGVVSPNWCPTCGAPRAETLPPENPLLVRTPAFGSGEITLAAVQNVVLQAESSGGGWVPLVFHGVCETATCDEGWVRPSTLTALMDWLTPRASFGTVVRTMRAAMGLEPPQDTAPPDTSITSGPSGTVASASASFSFTSTEANSTFECQLDAGAWGTCTSPKAYSGLGEGSRTFSVRAIDAAGNVDATPASRTWTVDTGAPDTSITSGPSGTVASASASFVFTATQPGTFECQLDAGAWGACTSPKAYSGLGQGAHTFSVRAVDGAGNVDASPDARTWTVDTVAPDTSISSGPSGTVTSASASLEFSSTESGSFECKLDAGAWGACSSPKSYSGLADGSHTFLVRAQDGAGNVDATPATRTWTVDTTTPSPSSRTIVSLTFDDGQATQAQVKDLLASRGMHATFYVNSAKVGASGFYMTWAQVDGLAAAGNEIAGHTLTHADLMSTSLSETQKRTEVCDDRQNLIARGYDPVSFAYPSGWGDSLAESIVRDCGYQTGRRVGGVVSPNWCPACGSPQAESLPPEDPFLVRTPAFGNGEITLSAMQTEITQAELAGGWVPLVFHGVCESATCGEGWVRPTTLTALLDWLAARSANGTVVRTMREAMGGTQPVQIDTTITSGPSGTVTSTSASFEFSSPQAGVSFECARDGGAWEPCSSPKQYMALADGPHTFSVRAKDGNGNVDTTPATRTWTVDATPLGTSITSGPSGTVGSGSASFSFTSTKAGASFECKLDAGAWGACTSPKSYSSLTSGSHTFSVRAKVGASVDATPATRTWTVDRIAPNTTITSGPSGTVSSSSAAFTFTSSEANSTFECRLDGGAWGACTSPKTYSNVSRGSHSFYVRAKDAAGNVDGSPAKRDWKRS